MERLTVGISVRGVHQTVLDAEGLMEHQGHRREAVSGAASVADNPVVGRIVLIVVNSHHHREVVIFTRRGDDNPFGSAFHDVHLSLRFIGEESRGLDHDVHTHALPGDRSWIPL